MLSQSQQRSVLCYIRKHCVTFYLRAVHPPTFCCRRASSGTPHGARVRCGANFSAGNLPPHGVSLFNSQTWLSERNVNADQPVRGATMDRQQYHAGIGCVRAMTNMLVAFPVTTAHTSVEQAGLGCVCVCGMRGQSAHTQGMLCLNPTSRNVGNCETSPKLSRLYLLSCTLVLSCTE